MGNRFDAVCLSEDYFLPPRFTSATVREPGATSFLARISASVIFAAQISAAL
jgi:hypothetical protein